MLLIAKKQTSNNRNNNNNNSNAHAQVETVFYFVCVCVFGVCPQHAPFNRHAQQIYQKSGFKLNRDSSNRNNNSNNN